MQEVLNVVTFEPFLVVATVILKTFAAYRLTSRSPRFPTGFPASYMLEDEYLNSYCQLLLRWLYTEAIEPGN
jgi:hypothetical protein